MGSDAYSDEGIIQKAIIAIKKKQKYPCDYGRLYV